MLMKAANHTFNSTDFMDTKVITLWGDDNLFLKAVEILLNGKVNWKVVRFSNDLEDNILIRDLKMAHPDVLVLHEGTFTEKAHLLAKIVKIFPKLKVVIINLEKNLLEVYNKQTICIKEASDLLSVIEIDLDAQEGNPQTRDNLNGKSVQGGWNNSSPNW